MKFNIFIAVIVFAVGCATKNQEATDPNTTEAVNDYIMREPQAYGIPWVIKKETWSEQDEKNFSDFVVSIYNSGCTKVDACLKGSGNPYRFTDPKNVNWYSDCGRWPYLLRAYFAWKNNLPFQSASGAEAVDPNDPNNSDKTNRYTSKGNFIVSRYNNVRPLNGSPVDGVSRIMKMVEASFTSVQRVDARTDIQQGGSDFYHVPVNRKSIRPGTVVYDPSGHVAIVVKILNNGKIELFDAHPDNSITYIEYNGAFESASPRQGGGFRNWRPLSLVGAQKLSTGDFVGGKIVAANFSQIPDYSLEQYFGEKPGNTSFSKAIFSANGETFTSKNFTDFVRARMSKGAVIYKPLEELTDGMKAFCNAAKERMTSVQEAITKGMDQQAHPARLPDNIYGTSGEWESYSTPSRDARLKTIAVELYSHMSNILKLYKERSSKVIYEGRDLKGDLRTAFKNASAACQLSYKNSNGLKISLNAQNVIRRLYKMSFDPYHCVELRWGASDTQELSSCPSNFGVKRAWYDAEQRLRNQIERTYSVKMSNDLNGLLSKAEGSGIDQQAPVDLEQLFL